MKVISSENFNEEVIQSQIPVFLEFYSDTCIPCKRMSPILAELEVKYGAVKFVKLNVNFGADIAQEYKVMASPTFLLFREGKEINRLRGVVKEEQLVEMIGEVLQ